MQNMSVCVCVCESERERERAPARDGDIINKTSCTISLKSSRNIFSLSLFLK